MEENDEDMPQLSSSTLTALQEFYKEREERENQLKNIVEHNQTLDVTFDEDWQLSQFWYDDETVETFIKGAMNATKPNGKIALISCPTLYSRMKKAAGERHVVLLEYDQRFAVYGSDFIPYDYKSPLDIPRDLSSYFDLVIADPPFLSEECLMKTAVTIKFLSKKKIILCTGEIMASLAERLLDVNVCNFIPHHKNNLANEFRCYSNFDFDSAIE
ncbi:EEF1A lysine methyltransferase 1 [Cephus cinctus]|uniref:Protein-lysine N-methyltransferase LOC107265021 n=1 Tax=Cephus cinctus TaxID=211228 RepID=A0AAJ7BM49_CEPCN|nr:EEF1A lysine methyltransferase 1 [Cephus cinctus]